MYFSFDDGDIYVRGDGDYNYKILSNGTVWITDYDGKEKELVIPNELGGYPVTGIDDHAFSFEKTIESVVIPEGVTHLGFCSFNYCINLSSVSLPDSLVIIGDSAFSLCESLARISIPEGVTQIGDEAFYGCPITSVAIPSGVVSIEGASFGTGSICVAKDNAYFKDIDGVLFSKKGERLISYPSARVADKYIIPNGTVILGEKAFRSSKFSNIIIPDSVAKIEDSSFWYCDSLTSVEIPGSVTTIGSNAFRECDSLTSVVICDGVTNIGDGAFRNCESLVSVTIPGSVTTIGSNAFRECDSLTSVVICDGVTNIGDDAFRNCESLVSVTIPRSVTTIGSNAFRNCESLVSVTIPRSVTAIGSNAFSDCDYLVLSLYFDSFAAEWAEKGWPPFPFPGSTIWLK